MRPPLDRPTRMMRSSSRRRSRSRHRRLCRRHSHSRHRCSLRRRSHHCCLRCSRRILQRALRRAARPPRGATRTKAAPLAARHPTKGTMVPRLQPTARGPLALAATRPASTSQSRALTSWSRARNRWMALTASWGRAPAAMPAPRSTRRSWRRAQPHRSTALVEAGAASWTRSSQRDWAAPTSTTRMLAWRSQKTGTTRCSGSSRTRMPHRDRRHRSLRPVPVTRVMRHPRRLQVSLPKPASAPLQRSCRSRQHHHNPCSHRSPMVPQPAAVLMCRPQLHQQPLHLWRHLGRLAPRPRSTSRPRRPRQLVTRRPRLQPHRRLRRSPPCQTPPPRSPLRRLSRLLLLLTRCPAPAAAQQPRWCAPP